MLYSTVVGNNYLSPTSRRRVILCTASVSCSGPLTYVLSSPSFNLDFGTYPLVHEVHPWRGLSTFRDFVPGRYSVNRVHAVQQTSLNPESEPGPVVDTCGLDRQEVLQAQRRFQQVNKARLELALDPLGPNQRTFLELLPFILHFNYAQLPGYIDANTPCGVWGYVPGKRVLFKAAKLARSITIKRRAVHRTDIDAVYLMGSSGTIAQSKSSDFDIWLCHSDDIDEPGLAKLKRKSDALSLWGERLGLEVHFFMMSARQFREQGAESLSGESSGSSQHHLLLDEFYRTSILVVGRAPLWWLVPPAHELNYTQCREELLRYRFVSPEEFLDFGSVADIEPSEFFGATLWQLFKAVGAPYKSLLKILLLEAYAADHPSIDLLCMRYKRAVYAGVTAHEALDPYILLLSKIEEHLERLGDTDRLALARHCLYFKANLAMSRTVPRTERWRHQILQELTDGWNWEHSDFADLDARDGWKIDRVTTEHKALVTALTHCYKSLSLFAREHAAETMISERDMTILGRKLFAVFEHKAGKIDIVSRGISKDVTETRLYVEPGRGSQGGNLWSLYRVPANSSAPRKVLKRCWSLLELLAWCHFNGLTGTAAAVSLDTPKPHLSEAQIRTVTDHLRQRFDPAAAHKVSVEALGEPPHLLAASTFINLDPLPDDDTTRQARDVTTRRVDPLSYSGWHQNLVYSIDYLVLTSWGECLTFHYEGIDGLLACLCEHIRWLPDSSSGAAPAQGAPCCVPDDAWSVAKRVENLFAHVVRWRDGSPRTHRQRFILRGGDKYYGLLAENGQLRHEFSGSYPELLKLLSQPTTRFTPVEFDEFALDDDLLATLYAANRKGSVQLFCQRQGKQAIVYILDENGTLFRDQVPFFSEEALVSHFSLFFSSVHYRQNSAAQCDTPAFWFKDSAPHAAGQQVDFYRILSPQAGKRRLTRIEFDTRQRGLNYFDLQVIGELVNGETCFRMYCAGQEFSSQEFGAEIFEQVTRHVLAKRANARPYPIYITDLDLSRLPMDDLMDGPLQTIHYLIYKKRIEHTLNQVIENRFANSATG